MAYDSVRQELVMFGGCVALGGTSEGEFEPSFLNDTWAWDGQRWNFRSSDGPTRRGASW